MSEVLATFQSILAALYALGETRFVLKVARQYLPRKFVRVSALLCGLSAPASLPIRQLGVIPFRRTPALRIPYCVNTLEREPTNSLDFSLFIRPQ
jgi:hypothetical protein